MPLRPNSRLITIDCSLSLSELFCLCVTFLAPLLEACTRTLCWHTQQQTSLPLGAQCAVEPRVDRAGRRASVSSLPAPPYLLIKELLNSQKLHRVQESSMHSNTIRKLHISPLPPIIYICISNFSFSCIVFGAYKCENCKSILIKTLLNSLADFRDKTNCRIFPVIHCSLMASAPVIIK